jgi:hypothetical protein
VIKCPRDRLIVQDRAEWTKFATLFGRNPNAGGPDRQEYRYQWQQRSFFGSRSKMFPQI